MDSEPVISPDVLARYAGDAASEVAGVAALAESPLQRGKPVEIGDTNAPLDITVHVDLEWGRNCVEVGKAVQRRVHEYVERMTRKEVGIVEVVVERVTAPPA